MYRHAPYCTIAGILTTLYLFPLLVDAAPQVEPGYQVLRVTVKDAAQLQKLIKLDERRRDLEIWADQLAPGQLDVRASLAAKQALSEAGLRHTVEIQDLRAHYSTLFPGGGGDFFDNYRTYDEHIALMQSLVATYPNLAQMFSVGQSVLGREMWALRITGPGADKTGVLYHGGQHGNEIMGPAVVAYTARHVLQNYGSDAEVTALVDGLEWYLLPIMNPDGYVAGSRGNAAGADLNRDWGGPGSQPNPFSQPETVAVSALLIANPSVRVYMDFHTHGYMIMWPWGHTPEYCEDQPTFDLLGTLMADRIIEVRGTDYWRRGPVNTTIYPVAGGSNDYVYGDLGRWAFTIEIGYAHYMSPIEILPSAQEMAAALRGLSGWAADCNGNGILDKQEIDSGQAVDCNENLTPDVCEGIPDFDGDGAIDVCDPDTDNDGVLNEDDICPFSLPGAPIHTDGGPVGDSNGNCTVDHIDYARFRPCLLGSGPGTPPLQGQCEQYFDFDGDGDVDLADVAMFFDAFAPGAG